MMSILVKSFLVLVLCIGLISIAGLTGILFKLWPTSIFDKSILVTEDTIAQLDDLKRQVKFVPDETRFYPGAPNEEVRAQAEAGINFLLEDLIRGLPSNPRRSFVLQTFKEVLPSYDRFDSEERDQALSYLERIMLITGTDGSGELLNVWRYGFPYGLLYRRGA
jgi:hypothetical protein